MDYNTDTLLNDDFVIIIAVIICSFLIIAFFINFYLPFRAERDFIKMELERSCDKNEYRYWKRELKLLYLRSIPLIGKFFE